MEALPRIMSLSELQQAYRARRKPMNVVPRPISLQEMRDELCAHDAKVGYTWALHEIALALGLSENQLPSTNGKKVSRALLRPINTECYRRLQAAGLITPDHKPGHSFPDLLTAPGERTTLRIERIVHQTDGKIKLRLEFGVRQWGPPFLVASRALKEVRALFYPILPFTE